MSRNPYMKNLKKMMSIALYSEKNKVSTKEAYAKAEEIKSRRDFLKTSAKLTGAALVSQIPFNRSFAAPQINADIAIVGAGLAGLACAYELQKSVAPTIYEAGSRSGGRCYSLSGYFPGQTAERGGELIDNLHKTMLGYAQEFNLLREDMIKPAGEVFHYFDGQHYSEEQIVDEFREFVAAMSEDVRLSSGAPTANLYTDYDRLLDLTNLNDYLNGKNSLQMAAGPIVKEALGQAYLAEYGLELDQQSSLNFLYFIHSDRRSKFTPFGVYSDERWHIVGGNEQIPKEIEKRLKRAVNYSHRLVRVKKTSGGRIELTFSVGNKTITRTHDHVVLTLPFSVLRSVELDPSLGIPANQMNAIKNLGYGTNAKMMLGFTGRPWAALGSNGSSYSDLVNHQATWETNPSRATNSQAILTDYSSGLRGANLRTSMPQQEAEKFLTDLEKVYPGSKQFARKVNGNYQLHLEHWPSNPLTKGSYTCYKPGQFTTIAGLEGKSVGNLYFAGEHTNSFYEWQGFMEGAALSGLAAAKEILVKVR